MAGCSTNFPSLARRTRLSPWQCLGRISSRAFSLDKLPSSPLALATSLKHLTLCNLTSITRHWEPLNASTDAAPRRSLSRSRWSCCCCWWLSPPFPHLRATGINQTSTPSCHCQPSWWPTQARAARKPGRRRAINQQTTVQRQPALRTRTARQLKPWICWCATLYRAT